jgi:hypothetical protein
MMNLSGSLAISMSLIFWKAKPQECFFVGERGVDDPSDTELQPAANDRLVRAQWW